jgi:hypothetical protein
MQRRLKRAMRTNHLVFNLLLAMSLRRGEIADLRDSNPTLPAWDTH